MVGRRLRRAVLAAALATVALMGGFAASAPGAYAHSTFLESTPAPGARVATAPAELRLEFTEPLNRRLTDVSVSDVATGGRVPATVRVSGGRWLTVRPTRRLGQAAYRLDWRSVSTLDGHVREGSISLGVGTAALGDRLYVEQSPLARDGWIRIAVRAVFYGALFFFAGGVLVAALLGKPGRTGHWLVPAAASSALEEAGGDPGRLLSAASWRTAAAGRLAAGAAVALALLEAIDAAGLSATGVIDFLLGNLAGLARVATALALALALLAVRRMPSAVAPLVGLALLAIALSGHANSAEPRVLAVTTDWLHLAAGAVWLGGIAQIASLWLPAMRRGGRSLGQTAIQTVLPRFGRIALPAFLLVSTTGLANALIELGGPQALWETGYGRVLAAKIAVVGAIALLSYGHAFRLRPRLLAAAPEARAPLERRHWRLLGSEPLLGALVVGLAAGLVAFPVPPSQLGESRASALSPCDPCPFAQAASNELSVAERVGRLTTAVWLRRGPDGLSGTLRVMDKDRRPAAVAASIIGAQRPRGCGAACWTFRLPASARAVDVQLRVGGTTHVVRLPASWEENGNRRARRLLLRAQRRMRRVRTMRQRERVVSAPGASATAEFRFAPPDRMSYRTGAVEGIAIGDRQWLRAPGLPWRLERSPGVRAYLPQNRFRWTVFASSARLLAVREQGGRRTADLALLDHGYPIWYRLAIDLDTGRTVRARLVTPANLIEDRYAAFNRPVGIEPPKGPVQSPLVP